MYAGFVIKMLLIKIFWIYLFLKLTELSQVLSCQSLKKKYKWTCVFGKENMEIVRYLTYI